MSTQQAVYPCAGPLFIKRGDVLPLTLGKPRSHEIESNDGRIAPKFDKHLGSVASKMPVKFQSDSKSLNPNLEASSLHDILR